MFTNKNKTFPKILLGLMLTSLLIMAVSMPSVHANVGEDILTTMGCDDSNGDGLDITDCVSSGDQGPVTSFIDFKGDLTPPNPEGYAAGLTQATDARSYILNVTNFFLGFLGLIAVLVVIYGGVLSVTSMGNPEGVNKGKKAITYAGIGLLIVMSSFALVNTILLAPSGRETATTGGSLNSNSIRGVAGNQRFNYLAQEIDAIILKVYNSYQLHLQAKQQIETARTNILGYNEANCVVIPMSSCVSDLRNIVQSQLNIIGNLVNNPNANTVFNTGMNQYLSTVSGEASGLLSPISDLISHNDCNSDNKAFEINPCTEDNKREIRTLLGKAKTEITDKMKDAANSTEFLNNSYQINLFSADERTAKVYQTVRGLAASTIGKQYFDLLIPYFVALPNGDVSTYTATMETSGYYNAEKVNMKPNLVIGTPLTDLNQDAIKNILVNLVEIKSVLENIQFVDTIISADAIKGNAPLIVNFSSVGSADPSGYGIKDEQIGWDMNGDGKFSGDTGNPFSGEEKPAGLMNCAEQNSATSSCIFTKAGTYRVTLRIKPKPNEKNPATGAPWDQEIAPGISYIDILVNPPATKINLQVGPSVGGNMLPVISYDDATGTMKEDHDKVYFTLAEAKAGLKFDAAKSKFTGGELISSDPTSKIRWNFGVPSENNDTYQIPAVNTLSLTQSYPAVGNYQVRFEVTDKNGVVDRKIFTVIVSNLAPRITNPPTTGKINQELIFDGSNSTSDGGPIIFNWKVEKLGSNLTAFLNDRQNWLSPEKVHAAAIDLSSAFSESQTNPKAAVAVPAKTLDTAKRAEKNDYYDCQMPEGKEDTLVCKFLKAGDYRVTLSLDDEGVPREESTDVSISSNPPEASFKATKISDSAPALFKLDAAGYSFDQDEKDSSNLEYSWEVSPEKCTLIGFADQNTDFDLVNASTDAYSAQTPCTKLKDFNPNIGQPVVKFNEKGTYTINLAVRTADEPDLTSDSYEQNINVDSVLDVAWGDMKPSAVLAVAGDTLTSADQLPDNVNTEAVAPVTFLFSSSQGIAYDMDFGDTITETGEMTPGSMTQVIHNYTKTGKYEAELTVFDADDVENSISRKIFIGDSDSPIAIITTLVNGSEVEPATIELENNGSISNVIRVNRKDNITFDAEKSLNTDGTGRRLRYSWNINNNEKQSTNKQVAHNFSSVSVNGEPYIVKLKVTNDKDATQTGEDEVNILVVGEQPTLRSLTAVPTDSDLTTPVNVKMTAVSPNDPDGQVVQYKWWYYDANKPVSSDERLGLQITGVPTATLAIGTRGLEGEKPKYKFGIELTDNDNLVVSTDNKDENKRLLLSAPEVQVTNGANKAPVARFTVDRTSVQVGETVNFTSSSIDPDAGGAITEYKWDFGDGERGENKANVSHIYKKANVDGYKVKLTVVDTNFSEATSDILRVFVDAEAAPPVASFTTTQQDGSKSVKFTNTSTVDDAAGASINKYSWDFDVSYDSNGDGKKDNDIDSGEKDPSYTYPNSGIYRAKLTVEDTQGQSRSVTNFVNLKPAEVVKTAGIIGDNSGSDEGGFDSGVKSVAANVFEAGNKIDNNLLIASLSAYVILFIISRRRRKKEVANKVSQNN